MYKEGLQFSDGEEVSKDNSKEKYFLPEIDRELIKTGLGVLCRELDKLPKEQLPKLVLFMETSARPLVYAVRPVLKAVYANKQVNLPPLEFFNGARGRNFESDYKTLIKYHGDDYQNRALEANVQHLERAFEGDASMKEHMVTHARSQVQNVNESRSHMRHQAGQKVVRNSLHAGDSVLIIDDYSRFGFRTSLREVYTALTAIEPGLQVTAFAFISSHQPDDFPGNYSEEHVEAAQFLATRNNFRFIKGSDDPKARLTEKDSPYQYATKGFDYRHVLKPTHEIPTPPASSRVGVERVAGKVRVSLTRDAGEVAVLRQELANIGEEFVKSMHFSNT